MERLTCEYISFLWCKHNRIPYINRTLTVCITKINRKYFIYRNTCTACGENADFFLFFKHGQIYRVIHKSGKHSNISQQINYSTSHGSSYADRESKTLQVYIYIYIYIYIFHRYSMCSPLVIRQTSMRQSISFHTRVSISRSTRATAAVIWLRK